MTSAQGESAYLEYELTDGDKVIMVFADINQRDGCHVSLDMYKLNLGAVDLEVVERIMTKFQGKFVTPFS